MNSVDARMHHELTGIWNDIDEDTTVNAAIITGAGKSFCAGGDFDLVQRIAEDFETRCKLWRESRDMVYNMVNCSKPIVSAINGPAVGAGLVVALMADISIAGRSATLVDGHTKLGIAAGDHAAIIWPILCGMAKAKYHLLLCKGVDGETAERIGLVSHCVPDEELQAEALAVAQQLADGSQLAIQLTKYSLNNWFRSAGPIFDASLAMEVISLGGPDALEGIAAFREKRKPKFGTSQF
jgi:enoyl-CoA hydratase